MNTLPAKLPRRVDTSVLRATHPRPPFRQAPRGMRGNGFSYTLIGGQALYAFAATK